MYEPLSDETRPGTRETADRENAVGAEAVAVPGALAGWCEALARFGTLPLADVLAPAIRLAERGFVVSPICRDCIADCAADLARDPGLAALFLPGGTAARGRRDRLVQADYAATLRADRRRRRRPRSMAARSAHALADHSWRARRR